MLAWRSEFFMCGHSMQSIDDLSYWDFAKLTEYNSEKNKSKSGKTSYSKISKSQKDMIKARKKQEESKHG